MTDLRNDWNLLNNEISSVKGHLKVSQTRWEDFNSSVDKFKSWLAHMRENVQKKHDTKAELSEMKTLVER